MCGGGCASVWMWEAARVASRRLLRDCTAAMRSCSLQASTQGSEGICASIRTREPASMSVHVFQGQDPLTAVSPAGTSLVSVVHSLPPYSHSLDWAVFVPGLCTMLLHCLRNVCVVSRKLHNPQWSVYKSILGSLFSLIIYESNPSNWWITVIVFNWSSYVPLHLHDLKILSWYKYLKC